jgi:hypothetical protein
MNAAVPTARFWPARRRDPAVAGGSPNAPGAHLAASVITGWTATVTITDPAAAAAGLDQVVPQDSGLPGFVAGYWMARSADQGLAVIVFDSQQAAQSFADCLKTAPDKGG